MLTFRPKKKGNIGPHLVAGTLLVSTLMFCGYKEANKEPIKAIPTVTVTVTEIQELRKEIEALKVSRGGTERQDAVTSTINKRLKGRLSGKGDVIVRYARQEPNVNPLLVTAIILQELGTKCSSPLFERTDNVAGINWVKEHGYDKDGRYNDYRKKGGIDESISHLCRILRWNYIAKGLTTIDQIGAVYCPPDDKDNGKYGMVNESWIPNVTKLYDQMKEEAGI